MADTPTTAKDGIYYIEAWPSDIVPASMTLQLVPTSNAFESPWSGTVDAEPRNSSLWHLTATFTALTDDQVRRVRAFIARQRGMRGRFYFPALPGTVPQAQYIYTVGHPNGHGPRAEPAGSGPKFSFVTFGGDSLTTDQWPGAEGDVVLRAGDYISTGHIARPLFIVTEDAVRDGSGRAVVQVLPRPDELGFSNVASYLLDATVLHLSNPSTVFMLADEEQGELVETPGGLPALTIEAVQRRH